MKIPSFNIRGVGSRVKIKEVQDLIRRYKVDIACHSRIKARKCTGNFSRVLWGGENCGWAVMDSMGRSGGIILLWNWEKFRCTNWWTIEGVVIVTGL